MSVLQELPSYTIPYIEKTQEAELPYQKSI
jgi:hypothetical protein